MKLNFDWKNDGKYHQYCAHCHAETIERVYEDGKTLYLCSTCKQRHERSIVIDPAIKWWVADDGEYWHESEGVFMRNPEGKFFFFERLIFPFDLLYHRAMLTPARTLYVALFEPHVPIMRTLGRSRDLLVKGGQWFVAKGFALLFLILIILGAMSGQNLQELINSDNIATNIALIVVALLANGVLVMLYDNRRATRG